MGSGTISLPCSGYFSPFLHSTGSLSVSREYLALPDGPGGFTQDFTCPALLRIPLCFIWLRIRSFHALWPHFPVCSSHHISCNVVVLQPLRCRNTAGLGSSPFARHYWGNHSYFLFLQVLRCFSSLRWPPPSGGCCRFAATGCPIRRSAGQGSFAPNRGFSQLITSFFASKSLGIHHVPFSTCSRAGLKPALFARLRFSISCSCLCNMSKIFIQLTTDYR